MPAFVKVKKVKRIRRGSERVTLKIMKKQDRNRKGKERVETAAIMRRIITPRTSSPRFAKCIISSWEVERDH